MKLSNRHSRYSKYKRPVADWTIPPLFKLYWRAVLPSCRSQDSPSLSLLGGRGISWENKLQTPYGTSSPCISWVSPRLLVSSPCVITHESSCASFYWFLRNWGSAMVFARSTIRSVWPHRRTALLWFFFFSQIKWGEKAAQVWAKRRQLFEQSSLQEPSCTSDSQQL